MLDILLCLFAGQCLPQYTAHSVAVATLRILLQAAALQRCKGTAEVELSGGGCNAGKLRVSMMRERAAAQAELATK